MIEEPIAPAAPRLYAFRLIPSRQGFDYHGPPVPGFNNRGEAGAPWHIAASEQTATAKRSDSDGTIYETMAYCGDRVQHGNWLDGCDSFFVENTDLVCPTCLWVIGLEMPGLLPEALVPVVKERAQKRYAELTANQTTNQAAGVGD